MKNPAIINKYASRLLMISFFLQKNLQVQAVIAVCLYFLVRAIITKKIQFSVPKILVALLIGTGFLFCLFAVPFTPPEYRGVLLNICEHKVSLLLLPVIFALLEPEILNTILKEQIYFVYACLIACIVGNILFFYHINSIGTGFHNLNHVQYRQYLEKVMYIHPTYLGMYICFSICILLFSKTIKGNLRNWVKYGIFYMLLLLLLASLAKSPLVALIIIFTHYFWLRRNLLYKYRFVFSGVAIIVFLAYFFVPFFAQRIDEIKRGFSTVKETDSRNNSINERKLILNTDFTLLKQYWITGVGPGRLQEKLNEHYFFYAITTGAKTDNYDPHSEFLWQWLSFGFIGIIFSVTILIIHFKYAINSKNNLYLYLLLILSITYFTESVLARQRGILLFGVFTSLYLFSQYKEISITKKIEQSA